MKSKKIISVIMALSMVAGTFAACGDKNADTSTKTIDDINNMSEEELEAAIYSAAEAMESSAAETEAVAEAEDGVQKIDIWKDIEVTFSGIEGNVPTVTYSYTGNDEILCDILMDEKKGLNYQNSISEYYSDSDDKYTNGKTVTLQINEILDKITAAGYALESDTSPEITISGLAKPLTAFSELSEEGQQELFDQMDKGANESLISLGYGIDGNRWPEEYNLSEIEIIPVKRMVYEAKFGSDVFSFYMIHVIGTKASEGVDYPLDEYKYAGSSYMCVIGTVDGKLYVGDDYVHGSMFVHTENTGNDWYEDACTDTDAYGKGSADQTDWLVDTTLGSEAE